MSNYKSSQYPLSNHDIHATIKHFDKRGANIIEESIIKKDTPIEKIFSNRGHVILFKNWDNSIGHWITILRDKDKKALCIDSLGKPMSYYNKNIIPCLINNGYTVYENNFAYQDTKKNTCGRHALVYVSLNKLLKGLPNIKNIMDNYKKIFGSYDKAVVELTTPTKKNNK